MKFKEIPQNYYLEIYPRQPMFCRNTATEEKSICEDIKYSIKRHIDDVGQVILHCDYGYEINGIQYDSIFNGLIGELDDVGISYFYTINFNKTDKSSAMCRCYNNFKEIAMEFYEHPDYFNRVDWGTVQKITKEEIDFLKKVVDFRNG